MHFEIPCEKTKKFQVCEKADLLCACYHLLENIIIYLTTSPSLLLDEKQILQLHSAMLGAFHSIIFFLKELSDENNPQGQVCQSLYLFFFGVKIQWYSGIKLKEFWIYFNIFTTIPL